MMEKEHGNYPHWHIFRHIEMQGMLTKKSLPAEEVAQVNKIRGWSAKEYRLEKNYLLYLFFMKNT